MGETNKKKFTISIEPELHALAKERSERLGWRSLSAYIEFLVAADVEEKHDHVLARTESGLRHSLTLGASAPSSRSIETTGETSHDPDSTVQQS